MHHELLAQARRLALASSNRPRQVDLRRVLSTSYYACFHALAKSNADSLVGVGVHGANEAAWSQTYRALEHGLAKNACLQARSAGFTAPIVQFAADFAILQDLRHQADYDPLARFQRASVVLSVNTAETAIRSLHSTTLSERRAFAAHVLFRKR